MVCRWRACAVMWRGVDRWLATSWPTTTTKSLRPFQNGPGRQECHETQTKMNHLYILNISLMQAHSLIVVALSCFLAIMMRAFTESSSSTIAFCSVMRPSGMTLIRRKVLIGGVAMIHDRGKSTLDRTGRGETTWENSDGEHSRYGYETQIWKAIFLHLP